MKKIVKAALWSLLSLGELFVIVIFEIKSLPVGSSIAGILAGLTIPCIRTSIEDIFDDSNWKESLRKYERGKFIRKEDKIRLSFAYLFRIKIDNEKRLIWILN